MLFPWVAQSLSCLLVAFLVTGTSSASSRPLRSRQSGSPNIVTGARQRDENGHPFLRLEIRDMKERYPDQFNLYLLALESLQQADQRDFHSYYGLAAIHGRPFKTWGDAPGIPRLIGTRGYCPHNNDLFLGWHRPYLALYEQVFQNEMYKIAEKAGAEKWGAAADAFRVPYWDWGQGPNGGPVPDFFLSETIQVTRPDGRNADIQNPLNSYQFHPVEQNHFMGKWASINATIRWPTSGDSNATSQQNKFQEAFAGQQRSLLNIVATAFRTSNFARFSSTIEQPHGWIHGVVGGGFDGVDDTTKGHFWPLEMSAFDPIFMLHHANLDRFWAMYQAAFPDRLMEQSNVGMESPVFVEENSWIGPETPLLPFRQPNGRFWTTRTAWDHTRFGYTYAETRPWRFNSREEYQRSIISTVNRVYRDSAQEQIEVQVATINNTAAMVTRDRTFSDWTMEIEASARDFPPPYVIRFELMDRSSSSPPADAGTWMILMPSHHKHAGPHERSPARDKVHTGTLSLTAHLLDQIDAKRLASLHPEAVVPYLKEALTWRLLSSDDGPARNLSAIKVQIYSTEATMSESRDEGISYNGTGMAYPEITMGRRDGMVV